MVMCIAFIVVAFFLPVVTSEGAARSNPGHRLCLDCFTSFAMTEKIQCTKLPRAKYNAAGARLAARTAQAGNTA
ncbi:MAG: hypothetical protein LBJ47_04175 [Tannerella sp.]|nr:hypothetical protein [Tannerella sp.]